MNNEVLETEDTKPQPQTPFEFLKQFPGSPSQEKLNRIKQESPGGRLKLITSSDGKRVYVLRAISAFELQGLQDNTLLKTVTPEKYAMALKTELAAKCLVWTNASNTGTMTSVEFKQAGAGLIDTLHEVITELSDYMDAPAIQRFSADL